MNPIVLQIVGSLVVAGASAWFGSWLGLRHAIRKLRDEKAFERRLAWCEACIKALDAFRRNREQWIDAAKADQTQTEVLELLSAQGQELASPLLDELQKATVYAPKGAVHRLSRLMDQILMVTSFVIMTRSKATVQDHVRTMEKLAAALGGAEFELTQQIRKELGIEQISLSDMEPDMAGFAASLLESKEASPRGKL